MRHRAPTLLAAAALLVLACCQQGAPAEEEPTGDTAESTAAPSTADAESPFERAPADTQLPAAIQGRWGLVPADCEPGRADAKGLLVIAPRQLEFYESAGTLTGIEEASAGRVRAAFAFTGEGMSWQRDMTLEVEDGGQTLVRREFGDGAATEPFRYRKC